MTGKHYNSHELSKQNIKCQKCGEKMKLNYTKDIWKCPNGHKVFVNKSADLSKFGMGRR